MGFIKEQIKTVKKNDPSLKSILEVLLYPSFRAQLRYRRARFFYKHGHFIIAKYIL